MRIKSKGGQFGVVDIFSYMMYFLCAIILIFILNIASCGIKDNQTKQEILADSDIDILDRTVRANAQLDSILRTQINKDDLSNRLGWLRAQKFAPALQTDFNRVDGFLKKYPDIIVNNDYSGFIRGLHAIYVSGKPNEQEDVKHTFKAVTAAMFLRVVKEKVKVSGTKFEERDLYYLPGISVDFDPKNVLPARKSRLTCNTYTNPGYELCAEYLPSQWHSNVLPSQVLTHVVQAIPLTNSGIAKVDFGYYPEIKSTLPRP